MAAASRKNAASQPALGFLTVWEHETDGLFGGYLALNLVGRPLEFHCTAPIKANRAQEILYGPTLEPYLYGEQIGQTLLEKATLAPLVICTDSPPALAVRDFVDTPVVLVLPSETSVATENIPEGGETTPEKRWRLDSAHGPASPLCHFSLGANRLAVSERSSDDRQTIMDRLAEIAPSFDLSEPFNRIREAIAEARGGNQPR
jgi:hypothetical protein